MLKAKILFYLIASLMNGYLCAFVFNLSWPLIKNSLKGAVVNEEGIIFVPIGYFLLFFVAVLVLIEIIMILSVKSVKKVAVTLALLFLVGLCGEILVWEMRYSAPNILNIFT